MIFVIYGAFSIRAFVMIALLELVFHERRTAINDARLVTNFGLMALTYVMLAVIPIGTVATTASYSEARGIGLLPRSRPAVRCRSGPGLRLADAQPICTLHRLVHAVPMLWRLHRIHHADRMIDLSTALRNHPLEQLLVLAIVCPMILLLGVPVWAMVALSWRSSQAHSGATLIYGCLNAGRTGLSGWW